MDKNYKQSLSEELLDVQQTLGWMDLIISSIDDAVCVTDSEGKLVFTNEYFANLIGVPRVFLLGIKMKEVIGLKKIDGAVVEHDSHLDRLAASGEQNGIFEWTDQQKNTHTFNVHSRLLPNSEQCVYFLQNITREYELTHMKDSFINLASHQLRTPMTAIMVYSHMLHDGLAGKLSKSQREITSTIVQSTERMNRLISGLLKITRIQSDSAAYKQDSVSLHDVFDQILTEVQPSLHEKSILFNVKMPHNLPDIQNDVSAVHEIFSNLVVNAVQYTRNFGKISISASKADQNITVKVRDTGIGIPEQHQRQLFNQFSRADNAIEEFSEGTGLGLYLVKILLDKIGGSIECQSKIKVGTTFMVRLPIIRTASMKKVEFTG